MQTKRSRVTRPQSRTRRIRCSTTTRLALKGDLEGDTASLARSIEDAMARLQTLQEVASSPTSARDLHYAMSDFVGTFHLNRPLREKQLARIYRAPESVSDRRRWGP